MGLRLLPLVVVALLALAAPASAADDPDETRLIVKRDPGLSASERADVRADAGVELAETLPLPDTEVVTAPAADAQNALEDLNADPDVTYAEPDTVLGAFATDPLLRYQWAFDNGPTTLNSSSRPLSGSTDADIDITSAWQRSQGLGVAVAVVDTGVDLDHPDLAGSLATNPGETGSGKETNNRDDDGNGKKDDWRGWDFVNADNSPDDDNGHGTHVAGTVAAARDNGVGVAGVAPQSDVLALKVLDASGRGYTSRIASAFDYAGRAGIRVVSASLGGPSDGSRTLRDAIARYPNTLYVVAAGNDASNNDAAPVDPCNVDSPNVVCVGASDARDAPACFSNVGATSVDLFAPGASIVSTVPDGAYNWMSGTSMATPHVSGVAALVLASDGTLSAAQVKDRLLSSVDAKAGMASLSVAGGRLNALRALGGTPTDSGGGDGTWAPCATDSDGDGVADRADACPSTAAPGTGDGCPAAATPSAPPPVTSPALRSPVAPVSAPRGGTVARPAVRSLKARATPSRCRRGRPCRRGVKATVQAARGASVALTLEKGRCHRKRCTWSRVAAVRVAAGKGTVATTLGAGRGLRRGTYRVTAVASTRAGTSAARRATLAVR
jgi:subtilisin family serine protease